MSRPSGKVVVVGAGVAGLAAAWRLVQRGADVTVLEATDRVGGALSTTITEDGYLFEHGPHSFGHGSDHVRALVDALGLGSEVLQSSPAARRCYSWARGALHAMPTSAPALLRSRLLSLRGKLRLLSEPLRRVPKTPWDETVGQFFERRIGYEAVHQLVEPFVGGVFAGDAGQLGVDVLSELIVEERRHGSLARAMMARRARAAWPQAKHAPWSLRRGLASFTDALAERLPVRLGQRVEEVTSSARGFKVRTSTRKSPLAVRGVVLAGGARFAVRVLAAAADIDAGWLSAMPHPEVVSVGLGFERSAIEHRLDGFGAVIPKAHPLPEVTGQALGVIFASSVYPSRAPAGHVALNVRLGGMREPGIGALSDDALVARAVAVCDALLHVGDEPVTAVVRRWSPGLPQAPPGHLRRVRALHATLPPGLALAGNYLGALGVDGAIASGFAAADRLWTRPQRSSPG